MRRKLTLTIFCWLYSIGAFAHSLDAMFISITEYAPKQYRAVVTPSAKADAGNTPNLVFPEFCSNEFLACGAPCKGTP